MWIELKGMDGSTIAVNMSQALHVSQALEAEHKTPLLGYSGICFLNGQVVVVRGTPSEIAKAANMAGLGS